ncbi:hypothetical protein ACFE04_010821 [Oxalis oulophora]
MVLGSTTSTKKGASVNVDYSIHIQEIKPWPPSQSLKSLRSVFIQWENGERKSGSTNTVIPSVSSVVGDGKIEFNESFKLRTTLHRETSVKFQKNFLEFNLFEPRRDKAQLIASGIVDLADYGVLKDAVSISVSMNSKRSFSNIQPILYLKIQPKGREKTTSGENLSRQASFSTNGGESVSTLMNEEYAEEAEFASFTDDDGSSHSSVTVASSTFESNGSLPPQSHETKMATCIMFFNSYDIYHRFLGQSFPVLASVQNNAPMKLKSHLETVDNEHALASKTENSCRSSSSDNGTVNIPELITESSISAHVNGVCPSSSSISETKIEETKMGITNNDDEHSSEDASLAEGHNDGKTWTVKKNSLDEETDPYDDYMEDIDRNKHLENTEEREILHEGRYYSGDETPDKACLESDTFSRSNGEDTTVKVERLKPVKSVRSSSDLSRSNGLTNSNQHAGAKEEDIKNVSSFLRSNERKLDAKIYPKDSRSSMLDGKVRQLENKVRMLEGELRDSAAIEAAIYSVVAEHGSSMSKFHSPARRLSRLYLYACKESCQSRGSAARNAVSGLVLVAKACGNDVPRLTFWLSNAVVLRAIISQAIEGPKLPISSKMPTNGRVKEKNPTSSSLKWKDSSPSKKEKININSGDWEDPHTFISALEKVEAWIFTRIIESIWWQTLTPHMQSVVAKTIDRDVSFGGKKNYRRTSSSGDQSQENLSTELWKMAFKDACERICPVRAGGHECGCLPVLARLIMEQCVARLDVAMFNAILRESVDEIPTDPVSDPISDSKVLPIPSGTASFGAGAQLKNAIGNWSRWLTDLFGLDDYDPLDDEDEYGYIDEREQSQFKSFHLLNALSDLMMLPKDLLLSTSVRKEVCPAFGAPLIKRVLDMFVPDEFCPDPIPDVVIEALESEAASEAGEEESFPYIAVAPVYSPPLAHSLACIIGGEAGGHALLRRSGSSLVTKSYTSDDELDELNSPLASIVITSNTQSTIKPHGRSKDINGSQNAIRYELLRDVWMNSE